MLDVNCAHQRRHVDETAPVHALLLVLELICEALAARGL